MRLRQNRQPVRSPTTWAFLPVALLLGASLTGCVQSSEYQDSMVSTADSALGPFTLPRDEGAGAPVPLWDSVLIVCPYDDIDLVPEPFAKDVKNLDTASTDSVQWLLFSGQNKVSRLAIARSAIDFCQGEPHPMEHGSNQAWNAEKRNGTWIMTPTTG